MARIIERTEASGVGADDYVLLCSPTLGERKFKAIDLVPSETTLIEKTITENGTYNAVDDEVDGYSKVIINVSGGGGESIDGLYFDGTNGIYLSLPYGCDDFELETSFYVPVYQNNKSIIGNTSTGYYFDIAMYNNQWYVNGGDNNQISYTPPDGFVGEHTIILNRLADRAILIDGVNIATMGIRNFMSAIPILIGYREQTGSPEFIFHYLKITDHSTGEVLADYRADFRYLNNGYQIPCLLNTIDGTYIDLNTGRPTGNNVGHIMVCQHTNDNYAWYYNEDKTLVVRQKLSDNSFRWYFNNYNLQGFDTVPANLQRFILNNVGARVAIGDEPGVAGFYDNTIRGWTPSLGYNITGITKGIIESTDTNIDYDNAHEWEDPTFDPVNG